MPIVCEPCGRHETYSVARLMERHGDAKMTDLLQTLANCPKARSANIHDRCRAVFERLAVRLDADLIPGHPFAESEDHRARLLRRGRRRIVDRTDEGLARRQGDEALADELERPRVARSGRCADLAHGRGHVFAEQSLGHQSGAITLTRLLPT